MTEPPILTLLERIVAEARRPPADWWDAAECADYLHLSTEHFQKCVASRPDFPASMSPTGKTDRGRSRLWLAADVRKWALRQVGRAA